MYLPGLCSLNVPRRHRFSYSFPSLPLFEFAGRPQLHTLADTVHRADTLPRRCQRENISQFSGRCVLFRCPLEQVHTGGTEETNKRARPPIETRRATKIYTMFNHGSVCVSELACVWQSDWRPASPLPLLPPLSLWRPLEWLEQAELLQTGDRVGARLFNAWWASGCRG